MADDTPSSADAAAPRPRRSGQPARGRPLLDIQLTQVRVPLLDAAEALSTPDSARPPADHRPAPAGPADPQRARDRRPDRRRRSALLLDLQLAIRGGALGIGGVLIVLGVFRSFRVPVPEGSQAVLLQRRPVRPDPGAGQPLRRRRGSSSATSSRPARRRSTRRRSEIPTRDDVRTNVDILMTFRIGAPEKFVFTISAPDFDQICQATCQEAVRLLVREQGLRRDPRPGRGRRGAAARPRSAPRSRRTGSRSSGWC